MSEQIKQKVKWKPLAPKTSLLRINHVKPMNICFPANWLKKVIYILYFPLSI